jgi:hypothetical protein
MGVKERLMCDATVVKTLNDPYFPGLLIAGGRLQESQSGYTTALRVSASCLGNHRSLHDSVVDMTSERGHHL